MAMGFITAWSYSRYRDYEKCPLLAKFKHVDRLKEPPNEAMERGTLIHKLAEDFALKRIKKLPPELKQFKAKFTALQKQKLLVEEQWAFNDKWGRVDWFARDAWCRVKMDASYQFKKEVVVIDHKTGRYREGEYTEQLELYALAALLIYTSADTVSCRLWFLDSGDEATYTATRADIEELKKKWVARTKPMLNDKRFAPKPGNHCRWCHFSKAKGGKCKF